MCCGVRSRRLAASFWASRAAFRQRCNESAMVRLNRAGLPERSAGGTDETSTMPTFVDTDTGRTREPPKWMHALRLRSWDPNCCINRTTELHVTAHRTKVMTSQCENRLVEALEVVAVPIAHAT